MAEVVDRVGSVSGRTVDKFATFNLTPVPADNVKPFTTFNLTPVPAEKVQPPLIAECPMNIECRVIGIQEIGDHDLFLGEVVAVHITEAALDDNGQIIVDKLDPLCYLHSEYWSLGAKLGRHGFSRR